MEKNKNDIVPMGKAIAIIVSVIVAVVVFFGAGAVFLYRQLHTPSTTQVVIQSENANVETDRTAEQDDSGAIAEERHYEINASAISQEGHYLVNDTLASFDYDHLIRGWFYVTNDNVAYKRTVHQGVGFSTVKSIRIMENVRSVFVTSRSWRNTFFIITHNNDLYAWGCNRHGHVGDDTGLDRDEPLHILSNIAAIGNFRRIGNETMRSGTVEAVGIDGTLWRWGGAANQPVDFAPVVIENGITVMEWLNRPGHPYTPIVLREWNINEHPVIDDPSVLTNDIINALGGYNNIISSLQRRGLPITYHALTRDGVLWAWGGNNGRLGDGTRAFREEPVQIAENVMRLVTDMFITYNHDWYFYSTNNTFGNRYELYRPIIAFVNVVYVYNMPREFPERPSDGMATTFFMQGIWFDHQGRLVTAVRYGDAHGGYGILFPRGDYRIEVLIYNIMLPSMVRISN